MLSFHIGLHKTGSTYLQKEIFPSFEGCFVPNGGKGRPAATLRHLSGAEVAEYRPVRVASVVRDLEGQHGNVLLSREALSGRLWDDPVGTGERTAHRLAALPGEVRVVICIRRQDHMLRSVYAQYVQQGGTERPSRWLDPEASQSGFDTAHLEYDRLVGLYFELFGSSRVLVLTYETMAEDQVGFARRLADFVGGRFEGPCVARRRNPSIRGFTLRALREWNRFRRSRFNPSPALTIPGAGSARLILQAAERVRTTARPRSWLDLLPEGQREAYEASNRRLQELCGLRLGRLGYLV